MMTITPLPPQELRKLLHQKIDQITDSDLEAVHQQLVLMDAKREFDQLREEMDEAWRTGEITSEKIDEAVREYRAKHPYRTPGRP